LQVRSWDALHHFDRRFADTHVAGIPPCAIYVGRRDFRSAAARHTSSTSPLTKKPNGARHLAGRGGRRATAALAHAVGPARYCSPRHRMPCYLIHEGSNCVSMTRGQYPPGPNIRHLPSNPRDVCHVPNVKGKTFIVTGPTSGIGTTTAETLAGGQLRTCTRPTLNRQSSRRSSPRVCTTSMSIQVEGKSCSDRLQCLFSVPLLPGAPGSACHPRVPHRQERPSPRG